MRAATASPHNAEHTAREAKEEGGLKELRQHNHDKTKRQKNEGIHSKREGEREKEKEARENSATRMGKRMNISEKKKEKKEEKKEKEERRVREASAFTIHS